MTAEPRDPPSLSEENRALLAREGWNADGLLPGCRDDFNRLLDAVREEGRARALGACPCCGIKVVELEDIRLPAARAEGPRPSGGGATELEIQQWLEGARLVGEVSAQRRAETSDPCWEVYVCTEILDDIDRVLSHRSFIPAEGGGDLKPGDLRLIDGRWCEFLDYEDKGQAWATADFIEQRLSRPDREAVKERICIGLFAAYEDLSIECAEKNWRAGYAYGAVGSDGHAEVCETADKIILSLAGSGGEGVGSLAQEGSAPVAPRAGGGAP